ncbi:MAG TPA: hypothetical protein VGO46_13695 [Gemmatimonadaceae bacterium]|nr:hypothetical protein [Gemmatimonadaceae bacterium]
MSEEATAVESTSRSVAILGADALLVALPSTPTQLANACFAGGFAEVFPATWGDELIAAGCLEQLESRTGPAIFCACPLVTEQLRGATELRRFIIPLISPPVAVARYLRALFPDEKMRITYVGDCPGADDASIDVRLSPHELLSTLAKRGILPATQRPDLGAHVAHDRRRFYSIPGGVPSPQWLGAQWPKRTLVDVHAGDALASLANQTLSRGNTLIDFAPHLGCACAGAVGGINTHDARKAVVALEPPRALSEIVNAAIHVEVSTATSSEQPAAEVTWGDFLAALPAALAMHPEGNTAPVSVATTRTAPRRALQKKAALPRAYMAARAVGRRERTGPTRVGTTQPIEAMHHSLRAIAESETGATSGSAVQRVDGEVARRDEVTVGRPNAWATRRASQEGMTGPRGAQLNRSGLATADRWLLAGLMLTSSLLVAVLTSALTVRGMQRTGAPLMAARADTAVTVAVAPGTTAHDSAVAARNARANDSTLMAAASRAADSAAAREEAGGSVAPPPAASPHLSPMPAQVARAPKHEAPRVERHPVSLAERPRTSPPPARDRVPQSVPSQQITPAQQPAVSPPSITSASVGAPSGGPSSTTSSTSTAGAAQATTPPVSSSTASAPPSAAPAPAPSAAPVNNAQFLEELRAIHAEIDARKKHMDSLTASLDSLKHIKP